MPVILGVAVLLSRLLALLSGEIARMRRGLILALRGALVCVGLAFVCPASVVGERATGVLPGLGRALTRLDRPLGRPGCPFVVATGEVLGVVADPVGDLGQPLLIFRSHDRTVLLSGHRPPTISVM